MKKVVLFFFLTLINLVTFGEYKFEKITTKEGLSLDIVNSIVQDSEGFMYFGTNALNVYDGKTVMIRHDSNLMNFGIIKAILPISPSLILIGSQQGGLSLFCKEKEKFQKIILTNLSDTIHPQVLSLHNDSCGRIWIGTMKEGLLSIPVDSLLHFHNGASLSCIKYPGVENSEINAICTSKEKIWIGTRYKGLFSLPLNASAFQQVSPSDIPLPSKTIWSLKTYSDSLFIGTENGLCIYDIKKGYGNFFLEIPTDYSLSNNVVRAIVKDRWGTIWIGTQEDGLYALKFRNKTMEMKHFINVPTNASTININKILSLYIGRYDNLWIGTWNGGVNVMNIRDQQFMNIPNRGKANDLSENIVMCVEKAAPGKYILGTHGSGICLYKTGESYFDEFVRFKAVNIMSSIYFDKKNNILWAGTWGHGLKAFSYPDMQPLYQQWLYSSLMRNDRIYSIIKDKHGVIWVGTITHGVFSIRFSNNGSPVLRYFNYFKEYSKRYGFENAEIRSIIPDDNNVLWIASEYTGLFKAITDNTGQMIDIQIINDKIKLNGKAPGIRKLFLDSGKILWISNENGILRNYNTRKDSCEIFSLLKNKVCFDFTEDSRKNIWIATYQGLFRFNRRTEKIKNFHKENIFYTLLYDNENNNIISGSNKGVFIFNPSRLKKNKFYPEIVLSKLRILNKIVSPGDQIGGIVVLNKVINYTDTLILPYSSKAFSIDITALSYTDQDNNQIYYKLENFDSDWNKRTGAATSVYYTNLPSGEYVFNVKAANNDNVWNPDIRKLHIVILAPWWKTSWAYAGYVLIILLTGIGIFILVRFRIRMHNALKIEKIKKEQSDKLHELKLTFFTNISHELRTPLTLILDPIENILRKEKKGTYLYHQLSLMRKNANLLLQLVNNLLDIRKIEKNKMELKARKNNLNEFMLQILGQFEGKVDKKNISLQYLSKTQNIQLWADEDLLQKTIFNLLSNAIRFTKSGGYILVTVEEKEDQISIKIKDNGAGIDKKDLPNIFDRFYQSHNHNMGGGSGIGLSIAKRIVELHKGTIRVVSHKGKGSEFIIDFKKGSGHFRPEEIVSDIPDSPEINDNEDDKHEESEDHPPVQGRLSLLIIDDNDDIRHYITENLSERYNILDFDNAEDAYAVAQKKDVSLIVCDIMLPGMDGIQFCKKIKSDLKTSHIPVILLTARTSVEYQIEGYEKGADDYIVKPFSIRLLKTRIQNLIEQRNNLRKKIRNLDLEPSNIAPTSLDEQLLRKAIGFIEENISNNEYSVNHLSKSLGLSHDNCYRKIKNLTGLSVVQFINSIRLRRAAQMLEKTDFSISEILYDVGFASPSYFTKCFKQQFGVSPKEYRNKESRS